MSGTQRWLFALYPRDFRRDYEEEMLAVLAAEGRPGPGQVIDLVRSALVVRLRRVPVPAGLRRAAGVVQLFGALLLLGVALRRMIPLVNPITHEWREFDAVDPLRVAGWSVVVLAALLGWRLLGLAGASAGLAGEIAAPARWYLDTPAMVLNAYWLIVAAAVVLVAGLVAARGAGRPRGLIPMLAAAALVASLGLLNLWSPSWMLEVLLLGDRAAPIWDAETVTEVRVGALVMLGVVALVVFAVIRQDPEVRRWLLAWAAPVLAAVPLVRSGFDGFVEYNMRHPESTQLINPFQWTALVLIPAAAFLVVSHLTTRFERSRLTEGAG